MSKEEQGGQHGRAEYANSKRENVNRGQRDKGGLELRASCMSE